MYKIEIQKYNRQISFTSTETTTPTRTQQKQKQELLTALLHRSLCFYLLGSGSPLTALENPEGKHIFQLQQFRCINIFVFIEVLLIRSRGLSPTAGEINRLLIDILPYMVLNILRPNI